MVLLGSLDVSRDPNKYGAVKKCLEELPTFKIKESTRMEVWDNCCNTPTFPS